MSVDLGFARKFATVILNRPPKYSEIIKYVTPKDTTWLGRFETATWESFSTNARTGHRLHGLVVSGLKQWGVKQYESCVGNPCNPPTYKIGMGGIEPFSTTKEVIRFQTEELCYGQLRDFTHARETVQFWISEILAPATVNITSDYYRMKAAALAGKKWVCNSTMSPFTLSFAAGPDGNIEYVDTNVPETQINQLTPQHLQLMVTRRNYQGILGGSLIRGLEQTHEVVLDKQTVWTLERQINSGSSNIDALWRYSSFNQAREYWAYNVKGQIGECTLIVDQQQFRLVYVGPYGDLYRYRIVLPFINQEIPGGQGTKPVPNPDYEKAPYALGFVTSPRAITIYTADEGVVHPDLKFLRSGLAGQWRFFVPMERNNMAQDKGFFFATWEMAAEPKRPDELEVFLYQIPPIDIPTITISTRPADFGQQPRNETMSTCELGPWVLSGWSSGKMYEIAANTIGVNGLLIVHGAIQGAGTSDLQSRQLLVDALNANADTKRLGVWALNSSNNLILTKSPFADVRVAINVVNAP